MLPNNSLNKPDTNHLINSNTTPLNSLSTPLNSLSTPLNSPSINLLEKVIKLAYLSDYITNAEPINLFLISYPESSKSYYILKYKTKNSEILTDLTFNGLLSLLNSNPRLNRLIIPDFLKLTEKNKNTKNNIIMLLNAFLEEGVFKIKNGSNTIDFKGKRGCLITATTIYSFRQNFKAWQGIGLLSRFLIFTYQYTDENKLKILKSIIEKTKREDKTTLIKLKKTKIEPNNELNDYLIFLSDKSPRKLRLLKSLLYSLTLNNNKKKPTMQEIEELKELNKYFNLNFNFL